jgi:hypothetical protein
MAKTKQREQRRWKKSDAHSNTKRNRMKNAGTDLETHRNKGKEKRRNKTTTKQEEGWCGNAGTKQQQNKKKGGAEGNHHSSHHRYLTLHFVKKRIWI